MNLATAVSMIAGGVPLWRRKEDAHMGDRAESTADGCGAMDRGVRRVLRVGLLVLALAPWGSGPIQPVAAAGSAAAGRPLYGCSVSYAVGATPFSVAVSDFNGDSKLDLVVANEYNTSVSVLLGNGDGTFQPQQTFPVGLGPTSVAVGDFNGDGKQDLVTTNQLSNTVSVLLGNGDGTFQPQQTFPVGSFPFAVAVGDFNGGGKQDLAIANYISNTVSVLLGNGDGTFQPQQLLSVGIEPMAVAVGDLNSDGKQDLVTANSLGGNVSVLLGNGDGTFQPQQTFPAGYSLTIAVGDFNGDGKQDLVTTDFGSDTVNVLLGNGDGTFQPQQTFPTGDEPFAVAVGDFNGDGKQDLVTTDQGSNTVSVLLGNGDGTFQLQQTVDAGDLPRSVALADFNGDGKPDIATTNQLGNNVSVLLNGGPCLTPSISGGYPTRPLSLSGYNFGAAEAVNLYWNSTTTLPLTTTTTDATGAFSVTTKVPQAIYGTHSIIAVGQSSGISATTTFQITPIISLMPSAGASGTTATAMGAGFGSNQTVRLYWRRTEAVLGTTLSSGTGTFAGATAITFTVPTVAPGSYYICAVGQASRALACRPFILTG